MRLSPRDRLTDYLTGIGEALFFSRRFDEAAAKLLASLERAPRFPVTYRVLAACYAHIGKLDEAREIVERLRAITPLVVPSEVDPLSWSPSGFQRRLFRCPRTVITQVQLHSTKPGQLQYRG